MIVLPFCPRNFSLRKTCRTLPLKQVFFSYGIYDWNRTGKRQTLEAAAGRAANWAARALFGAAYTKSERELMKEVRQERNYCFCLDAFSRLKTNLLCLSLSKRKGLRAASSRTLFLSQRTRMLNALLLLT